MTPEEDARAVRTADDMADFGSLLLGVSDKFSTVVSERDILQRALEEFANPANWHDSIAGCRWTGPTNPMDLAIATIEVIAARRKFREPGG